MASAEQSRQLADGSFSHEVKWTVPHRRGDSLTHFVFRGRAEKYHIAAKLINEAIRNCGVAFWKPAFCGTVGGSCCDRETQSAGFHTCRHNFRFRCRPRGALYVQRDLI